MGAELIIGIASGVFTAAQSVISAEAARANQEYQAKVYAANADAMRMQADLERQQGEIAQANIDKEKTQLRRDYNAMQGQNTSLLASNNVLLESGSALDTMMGNADLFAEDIGENRYNYALAGWEAENQARHTEWEADVADNQASWLKKTSATLSARSFGLAS